MWYEIQWELAIDTVKTTTCINFSNVYVLWLYQHLLDHGGSQMYVNFLTTHYISYGSEPNRHQPSLSYQHIESYVPLI